MPKNPFHKSLEFAFEGIWACIKKERNIKIHLCFTLITTICGFVFSINIYEWMICILLFGLVISLELVNSAIEAIVDLCSPEIHPLAKFAKDVGAGAVLISAIAAIIIGLMIFIPKLF